MKPASCHVRALAVADLHQRKFLFDQLVAAVDEHRPEAGAGYLVACVGDFLDANLESEGKLIGEDEAAKILSSLPSEAVFVRGNHEDEGWEKFQAAWIKTGRPLHALHGTAASFGPLTVVGFPCWTGSDQYYGRGRELADYSPDEWFRRIMNRIGSPARSLWLLHEPPSPRLAEPFFFEAEWKDAVERYQPLLVVSGHDHNTPLESGRWRARIGRSICINTGQRVYPKPGRLLYCVIDFEFPGDQPCFPTKFAFKKYG